MHLQREHPTTKALLLQRNPLGIGIDFSWRLTFHCDCCKGSSPLDVGPWGNSRDAVAAHSVLAEMRSKGYEWPDGVLDADGLLVAGLPEPYCAGCHHRKSVHVERWGTCRECDCHEYEMAHVGPGRIQEDHE